MLVNQGLIGAHYRGGQGAGFRLTFRQFPLEAANTRAQALALRAVSEGADGQIGIGFCHFFSLSIAVRSHREPVRGAPGFWLLASAVLFSLE